MDKTTQARYNFVLAFQYCWDGKDFPVFRKLSVSENERLHTGYYAIDLLDEALALNPDFQEARNLRGEIWHAILTKNHDDNYQMYLNSKAWKDIREKLLEQVGQLCICGDLATQVHHKTYENIGKEDILADLVRLCDDCHSNLHQPEYWDQFKSYVKENKDKLQLFPTPNGTSIYGIQIDGKTQKNADIYEDDAIWLVAYRDVDKLQANLCLRSSTHYSVLNKQAAEINGEFDTALGVLRWDDDGRRIGFWNNTVGHVSTANRDEEFSWLHDRLVRLYEVFKPIISEL